jgi:geranylgeranyl diphosphate synthase, type III
VRLVNLIGVYFQIRDDFMNLRSSDVSGFVSDTLFWPVFQYTSNKGFAEDLTEGKFSFPIVHAIHADPSNRQILSEAWSPLLFTSIKYSSCSDVLQKRPSTPTLKQHAIAYLDDHTKSFDYTLSVLENLEKAIADEIRTFGGNEGLERLMDRLRVNAS